MTDVVVGLGSNLGDRAGRLIAATERLGDEGLSLGEASMIYESEPVGPVRNQPPFLNAVIIGRWSGSAMGLLRAARRVEDALGREREIPKGPRTIDVDILFFGDEIIARPPDLIVPHPAIADRRFVLLPLAEVAPHWCHPVSGETPGELLRRTSDTAAIAEHSRALAVALEA